MRAARLLLVIGALQGAVGLGAALLGQHEDVISQRAHLVLLANGLAFVALALVLALLPAFTGRETAGAPLAWVVLGLVALADVAVLLGFPGAGLVLAAPLALALPLPALRGPALDAHASPFAPAQPHRVGDRAALAALVGGFLALVAGAVALVLFPWVPGAGVAVHVLAACLPVAAGVLAFLLPRLAGAPFPGTTLLVGALGLLLLAGLALGFLLVLPAFGSFRQAAALVLLAELLALVAFARVRLPSADARAAHARPLLRGAAVLGPLAGLVLLLSVLGDRPSALLPLAGYAHMALAALLLAAALHLAAPFLGLAPGLRPGWSKTGAALLVAGLFLLAPSFQYPYSGRPGALVLAIGALCLAAPFLRAFPAAAPRAARRKR